MKSEIDLSFIVWTTLQLVIMGTNSAAAASPAAKRRRGEVGTSNHEPQMVLGDADWMRTPDGDITVTFETITRLQQLRRYATAMAGGVGGFSGSTSYHKPKVTLGDADWQPTPNGEVTVTAQTTVRLQALGLSAQGVMDAEGTVVRFSSWGSSGGGDESYRQPALVLADADWTRTPERGVTVTAETFTRLRQLSYHMPALLLGYVDWKTTSEGYVTVTADTASKLLALGLSVQAFIDAAGRALLTGSSNSGGDIGESSHQTELVLGDADWMRTPDGDVTVTAETAAKLRQLRRSATTAGIFTRGSIVSYDKPKVVLGDTDWKKTPDGEVMVTAQTAARLRVVGLDVQRVMFEADPALRAGSICIGGDWDSYHEPRLAFGIVNWAMTPDGDITVTLEMMFRLQDLGENMRAMFHNVEHGRPKPNNYQSGVPWSVHDLSVFGASLRGAVEVRDTAGINLLPSPYPRLESNGGPTASAKWMQQLAQLGFLMRESCVDDATANDLPMLGFHALSSVYKFNVVQWAQEQQPQQQEEEQQEQHGQQEQQKKH